MASIDLVATEDNYMKSWLPTTNAGSEDLFACGEYNTQTNYIARSLLKFDFSSLGSVVVTSASLKMVVAYSYSSNTRTMYVLRCTKDWDELQSTWNVYSTGNSWTSPGGDWDGVTPIGTVTTSSPPQGTLVTTTLSTSIIENMINGSVPNYGFVLTKDTELNDCTVFWGRTYATTGSRPILSLEYTPLGRIFQSVFIGM